MLIEKAYAQATEITLPAISIPGFGSKATDLGIILGSALQLVLIAAGLWSIVQFIQGGIAWISSGGDAKLVEAARNRIIYAILGFVIVAASWALITLMERMLGICLGFTCAIDLSIFKHPTP